MYGKEDKYTEKIRQTSILSMVLAACVLVVSVVLLVPVQLEANGARVVLAVLCWVPLAAVAWMIWRSFVYVLYGRGRSRIEGISILGYVITFVAWSLAWALVYTSVYQLQPHAFDHVPEDLGAFESWAFFVGGSFMMSPGGPPPYVTDPSTWYALLLCGVHAKINFVLAVSVLAIVAVVLYEFWRDKSQARANKLPRPGISQVNGAQRA